MPTPSLLERKDCPQNRSALAPCSHGWGIAYRDGREGLLDTLYRNDANSARQVRAASVLWQGQQVRLRGEQTGYLSGLG